MLLLDIDGTISPSNIDPARSKWWRDNGGYTVRNVGLYDIAIANYTLDALASLTDVFMLSTWGESASVIPEVFGFRAETINYLDYSQGLVGIAGKFEVVKAFSGEVRAWADDHMREEHWQYCVKKGIIPIRPDGEVGLSPEEASCLKKQI